MPPSLTAPTPPHYPFKLQQVCKEATELALVCLCCRICQSRLVASLSWLCLYSGLSSRQIKMSCSWTSESQPAAIHRTEILQMPPFKHIPPPTHNVFPWYQWCYRLHLPLAHCLMKIIKPFIKQLKYILVIVTLIYSSGRISTEVLYGWCCWTRWKLPSNWSLNDYFNDYFNDYYYQVQFLRQQQEFKASNN